MKSWIKKGNHTACREEPSFHFAAAAGRPTSLFVTVRTKAISSTTLLLLICLRRRCKLPESYSKRVRMNKVKDISKAEAILKAQIEKLKVRLSKTELASIEAKKIKEEIEKLKKQNSLPQRDLTAH